jgi:flagellar motor component MotA
MTIDKNRYDDIVTRAMASGERARREGLLALYDDIDYDQVKSKDVFHLGLSLTMDGVDGEIIDTILTNLIKQLPPEEQIYGELNKTAILCIQRGDNPRIMYFLINSLTPFPIDEQYDPL